MKGVAEEAIRVVVVGDGLGQLELGSIMRVKLALRNGAPLKKRPVIPEGRQEVKGKGHERNETKSVQGYGRAIHVINCKISLKGVYVFNSITNKASHGGALSLVAI